MEDGCSLELGEKLIIGQDDSKLLLEAVNTFDCGVNFIFQNDDLSSSRKQKINLNYDF